MNDDHIDTDALLQLALDQAAIPREDGGSAWHDMLGTIYALQWFSVMAAPRIFRTIARKPTAEHLIHMVDLFLAYVRRGGGRDAKPNLDPLLHERLEPLARRLRVLLETWTPPELPEEITMVVRELLHADGQIPPPGGWDEALDDPELPAEQALVYPEELPAPLRKSFQ